MPVLLIEVLVLLKNGSQYRRYVMNHNNQGERAVLGEQCRNAFEAGQEVRTRPIQRREK